MSMSRRRDASSNCVNQYRRIGISLTYVCMQVFLYVLLVTTNVFAADQVNPLPSSLQITLIPEVRMVEHLNGSDHYRYVPAENVVQGQEIYYTVKIVNVGGDKLKHAIVVQPIPINTHLVEHSVTGAGATIAYSIDGGKDFLSADELQSVVDDRSPTFVRVTHIRWQFRHALASHVVVLARFRVVFD